jgi:radical SAM-linked protein
MTSQEKQITRIRVTYAKGPSLRFTGHLDLQRLWERLLRRSGLPIRYSQGFNPRARLNLASALPLGVVSEAELLDFWLDEAIPVEAVAKTLTQNSLPGLEIKAVQAVSLREKALQEQLAASDYEVQFYDPQPQAELAEKVAALLAAEELPRVRRKKPYDLRPLILDVKVIVLESGEQGLWMRLNAAPSATGRPDEVLEALGFANTEYLACRTGLILEEESTPLPS